MTKEKLKQVNEELNDYQNKNIALSHYNSQLESKIKEDNKILKKKDFSEIKTEEFDEINDNENGNYFIEENNLENIKKTLEQKMVDLQGLSTIPNEELKTKIISIRKIIDLLYKKIKDSDHRKNEYENKLIKLQTSFNEQLEEDKKEILKLYKSNRAKKKLALRYNRQGDNFGSYIFNNTDNKKDNLNEENNLQKSMELLYNENRSLKNVAKDLKKKIKKLKDKNDN